MPSELETGVVRTKTLELLLAILIAQNAFYSREKAVLKLIHQSCANRLNIGLVILLHPCRTSAIVKLVMGHQWPGCPEAIRASGQRGRAVEAAVEIFV